MKGYAVTVPIWPFRAACLLAVCACSAEDSGQSRTAQEEVWEANAEELTRLGLEVTLSQDGSQIVVSVSNNTGEPVCIGSSGWPSNIMGLDHFKVTDGDVIVPYSGPLNSVLSEKTLRLEPDQRWTLRIDLSGAYAADWRKARIDSFWAPFYECNPVPADGSLSKDLASKALQ